MSIESNEGLTRKIVIIRVRTRETFLQFFYFNKFLFYSKIQIFKLFLQFGIFIGLLGINPLFFVKFDKILHNLNILFYFINLVNFNYIVLFFFEPTKHLLDLCLCGLFIKVLYMYSVVAWSLVVESMFDFKILLLDVKVVFPHYYQYHVHQAAPMCQR